MPRTREPKWTGVWGWMPSTCRSTGCGTSGIAYELSCVVWTSLGQAGGGAAAEFVFPIKGQRNRSNSYSPSKPVLNSVQIKTVFPGSRREGACNYPWTY